MNSVADRTYAVRPALAPDLPSLAVLFDEYRQFYEQPSNVSLCQQFLSDRITLGQSALFVAESGGGKAMGFCQLYPSFCSVLAKPIFTLYDLYVRPSHRRTGLARLMMQTAQKFAQRNGSARVDLTTAHNNLVAQALYEGLGWQHDKVFRTYTWTPTELV